MLHRHDEDEWAKAVWTFRLVLGSVIESWDIRIITMLRYMPKKDETKGKKTTPPG
jgi:F420-0:gamma-glutamyl ligase-like protein